MSDQSRMDMGDPLGDRFWLSPKKGKWQTQIDHNIIQEKKAGCSGCRHWSDYGLCHKEVWPNTDSFFTFWNLGRYIGSLAYHGFMQRQLSLFQPLSGVIHLLHADSGPWLGLAELAHSAHRRKNKRVEGWFKFSVQISLLELVYNTKHFCSYWLQNYHQKLISITAVRIGRNICSAVGIYKPLFPKCCITDVKCWSEEYFGILFIYHREHQPLLSPTDAVPSVIHSKSVTLLLLSVCPRLPPCGWAPVQV